MRLQWNGCGSTYPTCFTSHYTSTLPVSQMMDWIIQALNHCFVRHECINNNVVVCIVVIGLVVVVVVLFAREEVENKKDKDIYIHYASDAKEYTHHTRCVNDVGCETYLPKSTFLMLRILHGWILSNCYTKMRPKRATNDPKVYLLTLRAIR